MFSKKVYDLVEKMTLDEKLDMLGGVNGFYTKANERLGIPSLRMSDASVGIHASGDSRPMECIAYPASLTLAATWNIELAREVGSSLGKDARSFGIQVLLGPGVNLYRAPMCGRNAEYMGEDPFLAGLMAAAFIQGIQEQGVAATVKHLTANNSEYDRYFSSSDIEERALREVYLRPFEMAVKYGKVAAVMTSYNRVNGVYSSHSEFLLREILKDEWGFDGVVMSDWWAVHDGMGAAKAGLDLEMPRAKYMNPEFLKEKIEKGELDTCVIDDKVCRILNLYKRFGFLDQKNLKPDKTIDVKQHRKTALAVAREGFVLLKNDNLLPIDDKRVKSIAVMGPNSHPAVTGCGGSSFVVPERAISVLEGIRAVAGENIAITWNDKLRYKDGKIEDVFSFEDKRSYLERACEVAKNNDLVVLCVGYNDGAVYEGEGRDRVYHLHEQCSNLIKVVSEVNSNLIVMLMAGGNADMNNWQNKARAILHLWYPGQEGGLAAAEILFGKTNPSGKLPVTIERRWEDSPAFDSYHDPELRHHVEYKEGIFIGYRHYDKNKIEPLYPFGFGLSYTSFLYAKLSVDKIRDDTFEVVFDLTNTGDMNGAEVVQLYIQDSNRTVLKPEKELMGFKKVYLSTGETKTVTLNFSRKSLEYFDVNSRKWEFHKGHYKIMIGASSRDIRLEQSIEL